MPLISRFDTPARVEDAPPGSPWYDAWSSFLDNALQARGAGGGAFFNPLRREAEVAGEKFLTWIAFPRKVLVNMHRDDRMAAYALAEPRLNAFTFQDEYFEWYTYRNAAGKVTKVVFVTETPEYYQQLWNFNPDLVVALYRAHVSPAVNRADLQSSPGIYNPFNRWNVQDGIMHYIMNINTLDAAVGLVANAAGPNAYQDNFQAPSLAATAVDPRAANDIAMLGRKGLFLTFTNPVGIYIAGWNDTGFTKPDGSPAGNYWRIVRGTADMVLRLEYEVPPGEGFVVGDMKIGGHPIQFGGQIAEHITVKIGGLAARSIR